jgi:hypothetical protein
MHCDNGDADEAEEVGECDSRKACRLLSCWCRVLLTCYLLESRKCKVSEVIVIGGPRLAVT